ncbi:MAG: glycosyltransferase family 4 protein [Spirochaetales bacterium]|nr:glycosyltransferase family 4 protein [Spirochaetales bacterium]
MPTDSFLPESVLFVITRGDLIGGAQIHVRDLAQHLKALGVRVAVALGTSGALQEQLDAAGVQHFLLPALRRSVNPLADFFAIAQAVRLMRSFRPRLVSAHTAKAGLVGRIAAWLTGVPAVFTAHGWQFAEGIPAWQKFLVLMTETVLARVSRRIITVSGYDQKLALRYHLGSEQKIILVHNGMPWRKSVSRPLSTLGLKLVMTARFVPQKDHETLFEALKSLEGEPWSLELIGDGPLLETYQKKAADWGWTKRVSFPGQVHDVPERLEAADVFILASRWEGFPRSILEAMRAGLPVVASDVGGVREAVTDGETGFTVPAGDVEALTTKLRLLFQQKSLCLELGRSGRQRYETEFTFEAMFEKTRQVWERAITAKR